VYLPDNWTSGPVILIQTPYNKNFYHLVGLPLGIGYAQENMEYAIVILDWRGFWGSTNSQYAGAPTRGEDGYSSVEWIATQAWCNGNVGTWGPSALGKVQYQTAKENPPHLKCIVPLVAGPQFDYQEYYPGGALRTEYVQQLDGLGFGLSNVIVPNPYYNTLWSVAENINFYPEDIAVPAFLIGGWYDHNVELMLSFFTALQNESPANVQDQHRLLFGPWVHGGNSVANVGSAFQGELEYPAATGWQDSLALEFFDFHLKGIANGWETTPPVKYFQMGEDVWMNAETWPPYAMPLTKIYFRPDGRMTLGATDGGNAIDALPLVYDPTNPSPTIGGPTLQDDLDQGPYDQTAEVESRNDVVIFTTDALAANAVLQGNGKVHLIFNTNVIDTDFAIRLCDVYPDGRSMLVCDGIYRARFINGFSANDESFLIPGQQYECDIELPNTAITFLEGHKIRIIISGSNYPRFNRNMNTGGEMYPDNSMDTLVNPIESTSNIEVSDNAIGESYLQLPILNLTDAVEENDTAESIYIFPNPAQDELQINISPSFANGAVLQMIDAMGKIVLEGNVTGTTANVPTFGLADGVYTVKVSNGKQSYAKHVVIK
jgi:predicted acyl esterase